jgi:hypothetical protein
MYAVVFDRMINKSIHRERIRCYLYALTPHSHKMKNEITKENINRVPYLSSILTAYH